MDNDKNIDKQDTGWRRHELHNRLHTSNHQQRHRHRADTRGTMIFQCIKRGMMMVNKPCLLCGQPDNIKAEIVRRAHIMHYAEIVDWLHEQGIPATWGQVRYFVSKYDVPSPQQSISPVTGYNNQLRTYIDALIVYDKPTFTINNLRLRGPSWSVVTRRMHEAGLIEPMRKYSPIRWSVLASKDEISAFMEAELCKK